MRLKDTVLLFLLAAVVASVACSSSKEDEAPKARGVCIPFSPHSGYTTCLLSKPQAERPDEVGVTRQALGGGLSPANVPPPGARDLRAEAGACVVVHDQGYCGWCVAHSVTAAMETLYCLGTDGAQVSPAHLMNAGRDGNADPVTPRLCEEGWFPTDGALAASKVTLVPTGLWPATAPRSPADAAAAIQAARPPPDVLRCGAEYRATGARQIPERDVDAYRAELAAGRPVVIGIPLFKDGGWAEGESVPYGSIRDPSPPAADCWCSCPPDEPQCKACPTNPECLLGNHAILVVGYDDAAKRFTFLNSWSTRFGDQGYGTLSYAYVATLGEEAAVVDGVERVPTPLECATPRPEPTAEVCYRTLNKKTGSAMCSCGEYLCHATTFGPSPGYSGCMCYVVPPDEREEWLSKYTPEPKCEPETSTITLTNGTFSTTSTCCWAPDTGAAQLRCRCQYSCENLWMTPVDSCNPEEILPRYFQPGAVLRDDSSWQITAMARSELDAWVAAGYASWFPEPGTRAFCDGPPP